MEGVGFPAAETFDCESRQSLSSCVRCTADSERMTFNTCLVKLTPNYTLLQHRVEKGPAYWHAVFHGKAELGEPRAKNDVLVKPGHGAEYGWTLPMNRDGLLAFSMLEGPERDDEPVRRVQSANVFGQ